MDTRVMELRIKQWIPLIEEQAKSGISKDEWYTMHGINRTSFFRWQKRVREYLLNQRDVQCENQSSQPPHTPRPVKQVLLKSLLHRSPLWK